jgi:hypothetical protein
MRTHALEALTHYDKKPIAERILRLYQKETNGWVRLLCIRFLRDVPGRDITQAMIDQALTDKSFLPADDLVQALNQRLNTSFRSLTQLDNLVRAIAIPLTGNP